MSHRPRIVVTPWRRVLPTSLGLRTTLDTLDPAYTDRVTAAGGLPLVVPRPPAGDVGEIARETLAFADGLLLSGGGDVDPTTYGACDAGATEEVDVIADAWELTLVRAAASQGLPTLGICRGAQIMAVAFGGRLAQHLSDAAGHRAIGDLTPEEILAQRHPVTLSPGTRIADVVQTTALVVNTIHHQAIADAGSLRSSATAAGDLIEAVEPQDGWLAIGVQWHPEKMNEPEQRRLFAWLIAQAR